MKTPLVTAICLTLLALALFVSPDHFSRSGVTTGQTRRTRPAGTPKAAPTGVDYAKFSHAEEKHKGACNTCHKVPTENAQKVRGYPDVADYPDHDACVTCHRKQFFSTAQPVICSDCHKKTSPRSGDRYDAFRNPDRPRQFTIEFPHDKHQDVIASLRPGFKSWKSASALLVKSAHAIDDKTKKFYNCEVCHLASAKAPVAPTAGWTDNFAPKTEFFKASPEQHSSCFNCHWDKQYPTRNDCKGCHDLAPSYVPSGAPKRFSMKFDHSRPNDHVKECTACHINITKSKTVRGLKPDVPITACTECHNHDGLRQDLNKELEALDKNKAFVCIYCHTSDVGKRDPKPSHYLVAGRKPLERKDLK